MSSKPLIFFVHVGKTAGSTVNHYLRSIEPKGVEHCESIINNPNRLKQAADSMVWLSGHVPLDIAKDRLSAVTGRKVSYFTCVRNPTSQVTSHYNWLIEIWHKGEGFYSRHPENIKAISQKLRSSDNSQPENVIENLKRFAGLFLNYQQKLVLGSHFEWRTGMVRHKLREYDFIANTNSIGELMQAMLGQTVAVSQMVNKSSYHFDRAVFEASLVDSFLKDRNALDEVLVNYFI